VAAVGQGVQPFLNLHGAHIAEVVMTPPWFDVTPGHAEMRSNAQKRFTLRDQFTLLAMGNEVADFLRCCNLRVDGVTKRQQGLLRIAALRKLDLCEQIRSSLKTAGVRSTALLATLPEIRQRIYERRYSRPPRPKAGKT
jgi:hypothetical protein